jgi:hypothetical protein
MASKCSRLVAWLPSTLLMSWLWVHGAALAATFTFQNGTATCSQNDGSGTFLVVSRMRAFPSMVQGANQATAIWS